MASMIALGSGVGPMLAGGIHDLTGGYFMFIMIGIPGALIAGFLLLGLGSYPVFELESSTNSARNGRAIMCSPLCAHIRPCIE
jgi:uncharacterized membrane protein YeaQ/YmgE (transglycosylase-associated protein family)